MVASESASTAKRREIPVRKVPAGTMLAELDEKLRDYEFRHEMSSETMATLLESDAIRPTVEVLRWYSAYQGAKLLREKTRTTGTAGTTTEPSKTSD